MIPKEFIRFTNPELLSVEQKPGSSSAKTFVVTGVYKIGTKDDFRALHDLRIGLGQTFPQVFADFQVIRETEKETVTQFEYAGGMNLEDVCLSEQNPARIAQIVNAVLVNLRTVSRSVWPRKDNMISAIKEAFRNNAAKGGVSRALQIADNEQYVTVPIHNDLTVTNIMVTGERVRFIDPRTTIPGSSTHNESLGCQGVDYAALYVSLYRKNLEREKLGLSLIQDSLEIVAQAAEAEIAAGSYSQNLYDACIAISYSVYVACACDYCMAPERRWLWEAMKEHVEKYGGDA